MKALSLTDYNHLVYEDVPDPQIADHEVLVNVRACGICGSDVHGMDGSTGRRRPPIIMGHEAAGVVAGVGKQVKDWHPGDRVTFDSTISCGACWFCRRGLINLCDDRRVLGVSCEDYRQPGAFAEYVALPGRILYRLPDAVSFEQAAMVEPISVAVHAVDRTPVSLGDTAVVVGVGMVGLLVVQALRVAGCGKIIAVDLEPQKLRLALTLGADISLKADECDVPAEVRSQTQGRGADVAIEVVGLSPSIKTAVASLRKGGSLTLVGNLQPSVEITLQAVVTRQLTLAGSCASSGEYPACLDLLARRAINTESLVSATPPLMEGAAWFKRLYDREPGLLKVILEC
ncbi:MAG: galactitol-1-phosphate 5-dehydrogenase [Terriglobia bacterium]|jgi:L-iditol 2-dehydrogenase